MKRVYTEATDRIVTGKLRRFALAGAFREPRAGEWYLSGAIPEAYQAPNDYPEGSRFNILRPATEADYSPEAWAMAVTGTDERRAKQLVRGLRRIWNLDEGKGAE